MPRISVLNTVLMILETTRSNPSRFDSPAALRKRQSLPCAVLTLGLRPDERRQKGHSREENNIFEKSEESLEGENQNKKSCKRTRARQNRMQ